MRDERRAPSGQSEEQENQESADSENLEKDYEVIPSLEDLEEMNDPAKPIDQEVDQADQAKDEPESGDAEPEEPIEVKINPTEQNSSIFSNKIENDKPSRSTKLLIEEVAGNEPTDSPAKPVSQAPGKKKLLIEMIDDAADIQKWPEEVAEPPGATQTLDTSSVLDLENVQLEDREDDVDKKKVNIFEKFDKLDEFDSLDWILKTQNSQTTLFIC